jgi:hypothetical protein
MNGFNLGADVNLLKWLQLGATLTGDYSRESSSDVGLNGTKTSLISFMAGPRIYFRGHRHQRSYFFDGLVGVGDISVRPPYLPPLPNPRIKTRYWRGAVGFGLDYAISPRFALASRGGFCPDGVLRRQSRTEQRGGVCIDRIPRRTNQSAQPEEKEEVVVVNPAERRPPQNRRAGELWRRIVRRLRS